MEKSRTLPTKHACHLFVVIGYEYASADTHQQNNYQPSSRIRMNIFFCFANTLQKKLTQNTVYDNLFFVITAPQLITIERCTQIH